jgi:hypothetical protein
MKILLPQMHPGFTCMLCRCQHQFFVRRGLNDFPGDQWKDNIRPKPENLTFVGKDFTGPVDVAVTVGGRDLPPPGVPYVYLQLWDSAPAMDPVAHDARAKVFLSEEVEWMMRADFDARSHVIEYGISPDEFGGWKGGGAVVAVGHHLRGRGDKGYWNLAAIARRVDVLVLGYGNDELPGHTFLDDYDLYKTALQSASVFLNPSNWVPQSAAEAMMMGMPVVQFDPLNYRELFEDKVTCRVVSTPMEAVDRIIDFQNDTARAGRIGACARARASEWFNARRFVAQWHNVFRRVKEGS